MATYTVVDDHEPALGAFIRGRMLERGLTITKLAELVGVRRATIYQWLGRNPPRRVDTDLLQRLALALDTDRAVLAGVWHEVVTEVALVDDDREQLLRSLVLHTSDLTTEELREAVNVALAAAGLKRIGKQKDKPAE